MAFEKKHNPWNKGIKGCTNKGSFKKANIPWNKGKPTHMKRCEKCGTFISEKKRHICRSVDLKGDRFCENCGRKLRNTGWERYTKICGSCGKKLFRQKERELKVKLVKEFGGKCEICGYSKYIACLEFHHKNRKDKNGQHFLKEIVKHPEKFNLFCNRCHREVEVEKGYLNGKQNKMGNG